VKHVINTSEILGFVDPPEGRCELCVSADAHFDEEAQRLVVRLEAFLRPADRLAKERHFRARWIPEDETVAESASLEECHDATREIFQRWVRKVREAAPRLHPA